MKLWFGFFSEDHSFPASMLGALAQDLGWAVELAFVHDDEPEASIIRRLEEARPDLVALSLKTFQRFKAFQVARLARTRGLVVVGGGVHATYCPDDLLNSGWFDYVVMGDGMGVFEEILENPRPQEPPRLVTGRNHPQLALYSRRLLSPSQRQRIRETRTMDWLTGLGCGYSCRFCSIAKRFFPFPLNSVADAMAFWYQELGYRKVPLWDETFGMSFKRVRQFRKALERRGLSFNFAVHTRVNPFEEALAEEFVALGVNDISFGVETASPKLLERIKKQVKPEDNYRAPAICRRHGLPVKINLLFGLPFQDREDYEITYRYVLEVEPDAVFTNYFVPFPGSDFYQYCLHNGYLPEGFTFDDYFRMEAPGQASIMTVRQRPGMLRKVDYDLAAEYMEKIQQWDDQRKERVVLEVARRADRGPWVVFGMGDYFHRVLEILSRHPWENLLGYDNYKSGLYLARHYDITIPPYHGRPEGPRPATVVITTREDQAFETVVRPLLRERLDFHGPVLSASSYTR